MGGEEVLLKRVELEVGDVAGRSAELAGVGTLAVGKELCKGEDSRAVRDNLHKGSSAKRLTLGPSLSCVVNDVLVQVLPSSRSLLGLHLQSLVDGFGHLGVVVLSQEKEGGLASVSRMLDLMRTYRVDGQARLKGRVAVGAGEFTEDDGSVLLDLCRQRRNQELVRLHGK